MPRKRNLTPAERLRDELAGGDLTAEAHARERIAAVREKLELNRAQLAERVNGLLPAGKRIPYQAIAEIESGARRLKLDELFAFAAALGVAPLYLVTPIEEGAGSFRVGPGQHSSRSARSWITGRFLPRAFGGADRETQTRFFIDEAPADVVRLREKRAKHVAADLDAGKRPAASEDQGAVFLAFEERRRQLDKEQQALMGSTKERSS